MEGGITAWDGIRATGPPEAGIAFFAGAVNAGEMAALAWSLEENTRKFYLAMAKKEAAVDAKKTLLSLASAEDRHKKTLEDLYARLADRPLSSLIAEWDHPFMEGGVTTAEAVAWSGTRPFGEVLEFAMGMEANAYDRYLKMDEAVDDEDARQLFRTIAAEEKGHLQKLASLI